jgi:glycogen debranching enzyme
VPDGRVVLKENRIMVVSDPLGDIPQDNDSGLGLYFQDTRFLSAYEFRLNGLKPILLSASTEESYVALFQMVNPVLIVDEGKRTIPQQSLSIRRSRFIYGGLHERIGIQNCGTEAVDIECSFTFDADFKDMFDVRGMSFNFYGQRLPLEAHDYGMVFSYQGLDHISRRTEIILEDKPNYRHDRTVRYQYHLEPHQTVTLIINIVPELGGEIPNLDYLYDDSLQALQQSYRTWEQSTTGIATDNAFLDRGVLQRSSKDLRILLEEFDTGLLPMAGIPWFSAPFGRDALIASIQTLGLNPDIASGTLRYLAAHQGTKVDPSRDEQPGKILHERRFGELANLKQIPHTPYYGSVDSTPLFLVTLVELMDWVNDRDLFVELLPAMSAALDWIDKYGDLDHDGFVEYGDHAPRGIRNQGWKDSHDSLLMPDGKPAERPIALVEVQGYVYHAKAGLARILDRLGETGAAQQLAIEAGDLRRRFEQHFWQDDHQFYAQALDGAKQLVPSITSNPGHCLFSRICDSERADIVTDRLLAPDMFSGWGIRTLSASSPHYNPMSYHNGTIWPHDNSLIAAGLRRYGHTEAAQQVVTGILEAGIRMPSFRLPELFCGFGRDTRFGTGPAEYLVSCNPQAWGAGAAFHLLQTALGVFPDATADRVFLSPMPIPLARSVEVRGMRVGTGHLSFRVTYDGGRPEVDIVDAPDGMAVILDDPPAAD